MTEQAIKTSEAPGPVRSGRRVRHFLLDRRFQLKYTAMILGVATVISVVLGIFLIDKVRENSRMLEIEAAFDEAFQSQLAAADSRVVFGLVAAFVIFLVVLAMMSVFITHRMVGPVFVIRQYLREIASGMIPRVRSLRRGDEFLDLYETLVAALAFLERRGREELATLERIRDALPEGSAERSELDALVASKRATLPGD